MIFLVYVNALFESDIQHQNEAIIKRITKEKMINDIISRIVIIESQNDPKVYNSKENAIGLLQIRPIMIREINQLIKQDKYQHEDSWCPELSVEMFITYQEIVNPTWDQELAAKRWNGGRRGERNPNTEIYYQKFLLCNMIY